jgi:hypothetical protein
MDGGVSGNRYFIWGDDESPYGPVPLTMLVDWIADERVVPETWVFSRTDNQWLKAGEMAELKEYFGVTVFEAATLAPMQNGLKPGMLRRIKILAELKDAQLAQLAEYLEVQPVKQWTVLFNQGDASDAMFFVMSGELRARTMVGGKETILATFAAGDFFGDMALFDHGPRSADVLANVESTLLKLSSASFEKLTREMPALAAPFLQATARTLSARIRADNKRLTRITQQFAASGDER